MTVNEHSEKIKQKEVEILQLMECFLCKLRDDFFIFISAKVVNTVFIVKDVFTKFAWFTPVTILKTLYLCIMSIVLHNMFALISYATCEWLEMHSFQ